VGVERSTETEPKEESGGEAPSQGARVEKGNDPNDDPTRGGTPRADSRRMAAERNSEPAGEAPPPPPERADSSARYSRLESRAAARRSPESQVSEAPPLGVRAEKGNDPNDDPSRGGTPRADSRRMAAERNSEPAGEHNGTPTQDREAPTADRPDDDAPRTLEGERREAEFPGGERPAAEAREPADTDDHGIEDHGTDRRPTSDTAGDAEPGREGPSPATDASATDEPAATDTPQAADDPETSSRERDGGAERAQPAAAERPADRPQGSEDGEEPGPRPEDRDAPTEETPAADEPATADPRPDDDASEAPPRQRDADRPAPEAPGTSGSPPETRDKAEEPAERPEVMPSGEKSDGDEPIASDAPVPDDGTPKPDDEDHGQEPAERTADERENDPSPQEPEAEPPGREATGEAEPRADDRRHETPEEETPEDDHRTQEASGEQETPDESAGQPGTDDETSGAEPPRRTRRLVRPTHADLDPVGAGVWIAHRGELDPVDENQDLREPDPEREPSWKRALRRLDDRLEDAHKNLSDYSKKAQEALKNPSPADFPTGTRTTKYEFQQPDSTINVPSTVLGAVALASIVYSLTRATGEAVNHMRRRSEDN